MDQLLAACYALAAKNWSIGFNNKFGGNPALGWGNLLRVLIKGAAKTCLYHNPHLKKLGFRTKFYDEIYDEFYHEIYDEFYDKFYDAFYHVKCVVKYDVNFVVKIVVNFVVKIVVKFVVNFVVKFC